MYCYSSDYRFPGGEIAPGVSVTFYTDAPCTAIANLTTSGGTPIANPQTTDSEGFITVYSASWPLYYKGFGDTEGHAAACTNPFSGLVTDVPTGTGLRHMTSGVEDDATKLIENADVDDDANMNGSELALNYPTHAKQHGITSADDHTFPGGITTYLRSDGTFHSPAGGGGASSPLTTKGDLWGFSTIDRRVAVGANGQFLAADSTQVDGLAWSTSTPGSTFSNVVTYGADPTGVADSTVAIQAAVNALQTSGGTVYFPPGTYSLAAVTGIKVNKIRTGNYLTVDDNGYVTETVGTTLRNNFIVFLGYGATIKFNADLHHPFVHVNVAGWANNDTYGRIAIRGFIVDANSKTKASSVQGVIYGTDWSGQWNHEWVIIEDCITVNVNPPNLNLASSFVNVCVEVGTITDNNPQWNFIRDIYIDRCQFNGGMKGVWIGTDVNFDDMKSNVLVDRVSVSNCSVDMFCASNINSSYHCTGIHLVGSGRGNRVRVENCEVMNSDDNGIEIDQCNDVVIKNCTGRNIYDGLVGISWFSLPFDVKRECVTRIEDCTLVNGSGAGTYPADAGLFGTMYQAAPRRATGYNFGTLIISGCSFIDVGAGSRCCAHNSYSILNIATQYNKVIVNDLTVSIRGINYNGAGVGINVVNYRPWGQSALNLPYTTQLVVDGLNLTAVGTQAATSASAYYLRLVRAGGPVNLQLANLVANVNVASTSVNKTRVEFVSLGLGSVTNPDIFAGSLTGAVAVVVPKDSAASGSASVMPLHVTSQTAQPITRNFHISDCDFYACLTGTAVVYDQSGQAVTTVDNNVAPGS